MDLDGDGYLSMYELEYFYDEQLQRMEAIGIECLPFEDCLCQVRKTRRLFLKLDKWVLIIKRCVVSLSPFKLKLWLPYI